MKGNRADAEEAFGNASIVALVKFQQAAEEGLRNPRAWLYRIFRNACMDLYRKRKRQQEMTLLELDEAEELGPATLETPQQRYRDREMDSYLRQAVKALPPRLRIPMVLRFLMQMPYREIARELRITEENVRKRVQQARAILEESLRRYRAGRPELVLRNLDPEVRQVEPEEEWGNGDLPVAPTAVEDLGLDEEIVRAVQVSLPAGGTRSCLVFLRPGEEHRPEARLPALERYVAKHPAGWKKRLEMAGVLYALGRWDEAAAQYRQVVAKKPSLLFAQRRLGEILHGLGRKAEAEEAFGQAAAAARSAFPDRMAGEAARLHFAGWRERCGGRYAAAVKAFEEALALEPGSVQHWLSLAEAHAAADRTAEALAAYAEALRLDPDNLRALLGSHGPLGDTGSDKEADRRAAGLLEADPECFVAAEWVAVSRVQRRLVRGESGAEVRRLLRQASVLAPHWPELPAALGLFHLARGQRSRAGVEMALFLDSHPTNARGWLLQARVLSAAGKWGEAAAAAARCFALGTADLDSLLEAGQILRHSGASSDVRRLRNDLLTRFPESWRAWREAACGLVVEGETERAFAASTRMVQLQPRLAAVWISHGIVLQECGRPLEAVFALERGRALLPRGDAFHLAATAALGLAEAWRRQGEGQRAVEWRLRAVEATSGLLASDPVAGLVLRGQALLDLGEAWSGLRALRAAWELQPFEPLRTRLRQLMARAREEIPE